MPFPGHPGRIGTRYMAAAPQARVEGTVLPAALRRNSPVDLPTTSIKLGHCKWRRVMTPAARPVALDARPSLGSPSRPCMELRHSAMEEGRSFGAGVGIEGGSEAPCTLGAALPAEDNHPAALPAADVSHHTTQWYSASLGHSGVCVVLLRLSPIRPLLACWPGCHGPLARVPPTVSFLTSLLRGSPRHKGLRKATDTAPCACAPSVYKNGTEGNLLSDLTPHRRTPPSW